jgi:hypothetical protein
MTGIFQAFTGHHRYHGSKRVTTAGNDKSPALLPEILLKKHQRKKKIHKI